MVTSSPILSLVIPTDSLPDSTLSATDSVYIGGKDVAAVLSRLSKVPVTELRPTRMPLRKCSDVLTTSPSRSKRLGAQPGDVVIPKGDASLENPSKTIPVGGVDASTTPHLG